MSEVEARTPMRKGTFALLYACTLAVGTNNSMLQALAAPLVRQFGLPAAAIGGLFSLSALIWAFASPLWGRLSDRVGRKPVIIVGLLSLFVSNALFAGAVFLGETGLVVGMSLFVCLTLARAVFGVFGSGVAAPAQAAVAEQAPPSDRIRRIGLLMSALTLGQIFGPGLAGAIAVHFGLISPIIAFAVLGLALAAAVLTLFKGGAPPPRSGPAEAPASLWRAARSPQLAPFLIYGLGLSVVTGVQSQVYGLYVMDRLGLTGARGAEAAAIGFMTSAVFVLAAQTLALPRLRMNPRRLMLAGAVVLAASLAAEIAARDMSLLLIGQALLGIGAGLGRPGFTGGAAATIGAGDQGAAAGLASAATGAGWVIAPLLGGVVYDAVGITAPFWIGLVLTAAMAGFAFKSRRLRAMMA